MRILNAETLAGHANRRGRQDAIDILEAGLAAVDPYVNTSRLLRVEGDKLIVGHPDYEPGGSPQRGEMIFDLTKVGKILVVGAGKGVAGIAKAIEDALGERLSGGHIVVKHGDQVNLRRIGYTYGAHPVPDEGCVRGCKRILDLCQGLSADDLVFTIAGNGVSALLTLPVPGVSLDDVQRTTYVMQIERGASTRDLNPIRNHLDLLKGGRITKCLQPATAVHIVAAGAGFVADGPDGYDRLLRRNGWHHTLPDWSTFADAVSLLHKHNAWEAAPESVRDHLLKADPAQETLKAVDFERMRFRVFNVMPKRLGVLPAASRRAAELGYEPHVLYSWVHTEAAPTGGVVASIAKTIANEDRPFRPPCALITTGELLVTVGNAQGVGGRNQEFALAAALTLAGTKGIVVGAIDTDGTDGPGTQFVGEESALPTLAGGIVDGETAAEATSAGIDLYRYLAEHNTTPALWRLSSGIEATQSLGVGDLSVTLIGSEKG
ncbi:MAG: glycerate kinase type-2 family protein [Chloroflexota bacterium]